MFEKLFNKSASYAEKVISKLAQLKVLDLRNQVENLIRNIYTDKPEVFSGVLQRLEGLKNSQDPKALFEVARDAMNYIPSNNRGDLERLSALVSQIENLTSETPAAPQANQPKQTGPVFSQEVQDVQKFLNKTLVPADEWIPIGEDGFWGPDTQAALGRWGKINKIQSNNANNLMQLALNKARSARAAV